VIDRSRRPLWRRPPALVVALVVAASVLVIGSDSARGEPSPCPTSNPPTELVVAGGSDQIAQLGKPFQLNLQVELANTNGCPLTGSLGGVAIRFDAPGSGASGIFASTGTNQTTVGTDANGMATAPTFTANDTAGNYTVDVHSGYGSVGLFLSNTASGVVASIVAAGATAQEATVDSQYAQPLQAQVLDANGKPVQGVTVVFVLQPGPHGAGAAFLGGAGQASATTNAAGQATSPQVVANATAGGVTAIATAGSATLSFHLRNLAGSPTALTAGAASGEATPTHTAYPIRLAVTVTDEEGNPVPGAVVRFSAPPQGPSARFRRARGSRIARATTDALGIAIAPRLIANGKAGGFAVTARVVGTSARTAFALVNERRRR